MKNLILTTILLSSFTTLAMGSDSTSLEGKMSNEYADPSYNANGKMEVDDPTVVVMNKEEFIQHYKNRTRSIYSRFCSADRLNSNQVNSRNLVTTFGAAGPVHKKELEEDRTFCKSVARSTSKLKDQIALYERYRKHICERRYGDDYPVAAKANKVSNGSKLKNCLSVARQLTVTESLKLSINKLGQVNRMPTIGQLADNQTPEEALLSYWEHRDEGSGKTADDDFSDALVIENEESQSAVVVEP